MGEMQKAGKKDMVFVVGSCRGTFPIQSAPSASKRMRMVALISQPVVLINRNSSTCGALVLNPWINGSNFSRINTNLASDEHFVMDWPGASGLWRAYDVIPRCPEICAMAHCMVAATWWPCKRKETCNNPKQAGVMASLQCCWILSHGKLRFPHTVNPGSYLWAGHTTEPQCERFSAGLTSVFRAMERDCIPTNAQYAASMTMIDGLRRRPK